MFPIPLNTYTMLLLAAGMVIATMLVMALGRVTRMDAGLRWGGWRAVLQALGWGGLLAVAGIAWLRYLLHTGNYLPVPQIPHWSDWLVLVLLLPCVEELLFRGAVFGGLQRAWHLPWALLFSAVIATLCLPMQLWLAYSLLCSIGYALARHLSGSLLAALGAHMLVAVTLVLVRLHPAPIAAYSGLALAKSAGLALLFVSIGSVGARHHQE